MPTYNLNLPGGQTATITGARPFATKQTGGVNGAISVLDASGAESNVALNGEAGETVFAKTDPGRALANAVVAAANNSPVSTVAPAITGTAQVGQQLTTTGGTFTGTPAVTKAYVWKRDNVAIPGATAANYTPVVGDIGKLITVTVTGTNTHGSAERTSAATAAVIAA